MLFSCRKQLHDRIYSLRGEIWAYATSLTPPRFVEAPVPNQHRTQSCIYVLCISIFAPFYNFSIRFWNCSSINVI
jgi:hypothetical protein